MSLPPDTELLETLGEGNFGVVYVARLREGAIARTVVLKVLKQHLAENDQALVRARDEAALLARLNHDHIVKVEQLTALRALPTVVMEHVLGLTLDRVLYERGPLPVGVALDIAARVASALDAAYFRVPPGEQSPLRVIHRDIKPSNVIVSVGGLVKVLDFGAARGDFADRLAQTQSMALGTPIYMAPEIFEGEAPDPSVDIYALGATLYELIAGAPLGTLSFKPEQHGRKLKARLEQLRPLDLTENAAGPLRELIGRALAYDPKQRPSAREFQAECRAYKRRLGRTIPLDQWAETVIEPLYDQREPWPPPVDGSLLLPPRPGTDAARAASTHGSALLGSGLRGTDWSNLPTVVASTPVPGVLHTAMLEELELDEESQDAPRTAIPNTKTHVHYDKIRPDKIKSQSGSSSAGGSAPPPEPPLPAPNGRRMATLAGLGMLLGLTLALCAGLLRRGDPEASPQEPPQEAEVAALGLAVLEEVAGAGEDAPQETGPGGSTPTAKGPQEKAPQADDPKATAPEANDSKADDPKATNLKGSASKENNRKEPPPKTIPPKESTPKAPATTTPPPLTAAPNDPPRPLAPPPAGPTKLDVWVRSLPAGAALTIGHELVIAPAQVPNLDAGPLTVGVSFPGAGGAVTGRCSLDVGPGHTDFVFRIEGDQIRCP